MRTKPTLAHEMALWQQGHRYVAGVDEAGRGCLAGPVVAAAVMLPPHAHLDGVNDSKLLNAKRREDLLLSIQKQALAIGIGQCSPEEIDQLNILWAALEAMRRAVVNLCVAQPDFLLIDGNRVWPNCAWPHETLVKGDRRSLSIAAASIVAKVTRDRLMVKLDQAFPVYGWARHKGYPTQAHYTALAEHGPSVHHRQSFRLMR